jgi:hypothetical protein
MYFFKIRKLESSLAILCAFSGCPSNIHAFLVVGVDGCVLRAIFMVAKAETRMSTGTQKSASAHDCAQTDNNKCLFSIKNGGFVVAPSNSWLDTSLCRNPYRRSDVQQGS